MASRTERTDLGIVSLPKSFNPRDHITDDAPGKGDARFFGKTLGKRDDLVYVETEEGVYEFNINQIISIRPLHPKLDMLTISRNATFIRYGTISETIRLNSTTDYQRVSDKEIEEMAKRKAPLREIVDTLGGIGTREWRG